MTMDQPITEKIDIPPWASNLLSGVGQVACVAVLEHSARTRGFADGQMDGKRRGALIVLQAAKRRFGSKNQALLAEYLSRHERAEFFDDTTAEAIDA